MNSFIFACYGTPTVSISNTGEVKPIVSRHLDINGDGTGNKNAIGNYAAAADKFLIQPDAGEVFRIERMIVSYRGVAGFRAERYGNTGAALSNGITIQTARNGIQTKDLCDGIPIVTDADWGRMCFDAVLKTWGVGQEFITVRWTFAKSGTPIRLIGSENDSLEVVLNDDFSALTSQYFLVQGYKE